MSTPVKLSTAYAVPGGALGTFIIAQELDYNGVEIMARGEKASQDTTRLTALVERHDQSVLAARASTLLVTRRVFDTDPQDKVDCSIELAYYLRVPTVVLHPPLFWQTYYARSFTTRVAQCETTTDIHLAVKNMLT